MLTLNSWKRVIYSFQMPATLEMPAIYKFIFANYWIF